MDFKYEIVEAKPIPVISVRKKTTVGKLPTELGKAYGSIVNYLTGLGETPVGPAFAAYYNMDMEDLDVEMGFPLENVVDSSEELVVKEIPGGKQISYMYKGSYAEMEPTYNEMMLYMAENGLEPTGIAYEFYYNAPDEVPEKELLTKIMFPLK